MPQDVDLAPLEDATNLKLLMLEQRDTPSLLSLAHHPSLEIVKVVGSADASEVEALKATPSLRLISAAARHWVREAGEFVEKEWEGIHDLEAYRFELMRQ